mgnify:CR=1 FL=1
MRVIESVDVLEGMGEYLGSAALAQWSPTGDYLDHPDLPAVVFRGVDAPSTILVLTVTEYDVALAVRAPGHDTRVVDRLADAVFKHFETVREASTVWDAGSATLTMALPWGELTVTNVERMTRGTPEFTSDGKYSGDRWTRTDQYRVHVDRDE